MLSPRQISIPNNSGRLNWIYVFSANKLYKLYKIQENHTENWTKRVKWLCPKSLFVHCQFYLHSVDYGWWVDSSKTLAIQLATCNRFLVLIGSFIMLVGSGTECLPMKCFCNVYFLSLTIFQIKWFIAQIRNGILVWMAKKRHVR